METNSQQGMKIAVNSRIYSQRNTGIPYYTESVYGEIIKRQEVVFYQTNSSKKIGNTVTVPLPHTDINSAKFDLFTIKKQIQEGVYDIYHSTSSVLPFQRIRGLKQVITIYDCAFKVRPQDNSRVYNTYIDVALKHSINTSDHIITISENSKKDIIKYYNAPEEKISVTYLAAKPLFSAKKPKKIRDGSYIVTITTHPERKNIYKIIDALATDARLSHLSFIICGVLSDEQKSKLTQVITQLKLQDRVELFGYASDTDLHSLLAYAECFIYPSYYEGFGLPVLEAIQSNCPIVASNVSSIPELVPNHDWLCNPYSQEDIADKLSRIVALSSIQRKKLIETNKKFAQKFSWEQTALETERIFKSIL